MIDFSMYTLTELQAMSAVLDDLTYRMSISEPMGIVCINFLNAYHE